MISIITPVHNCLSHNEIYLESLKKHTYSPFELIVIDNCSTDGSYELGHLLAHQKKRGRNRRCSSCNDCLLVLYASFYQGDQSGSSPNRVGKNKPKNIK
ncbi:MAG: glycosyltransferase family 2 protein [Deltaproteobacteria bacterium]|nr:glycosyltransferase family 2 protein [Deltaproteobacteria bacterium]